MHRALVVIVAFEDVQSLDAVGPLEVFARTTRWLEQNPRATSGPLYDVELVGARPGPIVASSGLTLMPKRSIAAVRGKLDTVLVAGGRGTDGACGDRRFLGHVTRVARLTRRLGSVCTGAFVLATAGFLDGRRATTHWGYVEALAARFPRVDVCPDAIYVKDGKVYTSAGVTAGIDLALALVEEDHGREVALAVARELVVFARRPGGQTQFSVQLAAQAEQRRLQEVQQWMLAHPDADLSMEACAKRCGMSVRNFARVFTRDVGRSPAAWVEAMRIERARELLEDTDRGVDDVARRCGFGSPETMRRAFQRRLRVSPRDYRERFQARERGLS